MGHVISATLTNFPFRTICHQTRLRVGTSTSRLPFLFFFLQSSPDRVELSPSASSVITITSSLLDSPLLYRYIYRETQNVCHDTYVCRFFDPLCPLLLLPSVLPSSSSYQMVSQKLLSHCTAPNLYPPTPSQYGLLRSQISSQYLYFKQIVPLCPLRGG